ncbi:MAG: NAD+ synthase [Desulfovibrionaceae bacterium]|nr:NAD+ synthase [Desulfovibrionaceae bacterium]
MKIAMLQCNSVPGDVAGNAARIAQAVRQARDAGASLCVTPELALCGPSPRDLLTTAGFMDGCRRALRWLAAELADCPPVLVGAPMLNPQQSARRVSNAAVLLERGTDSVISRKVYQSQGGGPSDDSRYFDKGISCGIITVEGWRLGVVLCEDSWDNDGFWTIQHGTLHNPLMEMIRRGVDAVVQMTAGTFFVGGQAVREHTLSHVAARHHVHLFSVNAVGGNDGQVCHGQSLAFDATGQLLARARAFEEDVALVDTAPDAAVRSVAPACACPEEECWRALVLGTRDYVRKSGCSRAVVGLSGGMDSALVCAVAAEALGPDNVLGVRMPSVHTSQSSLDDAAALAENLGVKLLTVPITPAVDAFAGMLAPVLESCPAGPEDTTFDNLQARARGTLLMGIANRTGALVLNTGNKSECAVGYCTLYGDGVGAVGVLADVPKTFAYRVAAWFNGQRGAALIPQAIFEKAPTAELHPGQKDSDSLPPYDVLDTVVQRMLERGQSTEPEDDGGEECSLAAEVRDKMLRAEFKRRQLPVGIQISRTPFGSGWSIPAVSRWRMPEE